MLRTPLLPLLKLYTLFQTQEPEAISDSVTHICQRLDKGVPPGKGYLYKMNKSVKRTPRVGPCPPLLPLFDSL